MTQQLSYLYSLTPVNSSGKWKKNSLNQEYQSIPPPPNAIHKRLKYSKWSPPQNQYGGLFNKSWFFWCSFHGKWIPLAYLKQFILQYSPNHSTCGVTGRDPWNFPQHHINRDISSPGTVWEPVSDLGTLRARGQNGENVKWGHVKRLLGGQDRWTWVSEGFGFLCYVR